MNVDGNNRQALICSFSRICAAVFAILLLSFLVSEVKADAQSTETTAQTKKLTNIALGCSYTLSPPPDYEYTRDDGDAEQLTDGIYTKGHFWTQKSTVGWSAGHPVQIVIDLKQPQLIAGLSYNTAAGVADVAWPEAIDISVSDDGKLWSAAGDLVALDSEHGSLPPKGKYAVHRYYTDKLECHGRFIALQITASAYAFCDEIEVYRGLNAFLKEKPSGQGFSDLRSAYLSRAFSTAVHRRIRADAKAIQNEIESAHISLAAKSALLLQLTAAQRAETSYKPDLQKPAILPFGDPHSQILAVRAALWKHLGRHMSVWQCSPWDPIAPGVLPLTISAPGIELVMLGNEVRSAVLNVCNPEQDSARVTVRFTGLPGGSRPPSISVRQVEWTATSAGPPVACALPAARQSALGWSIDVAPGLVRQIWFSINTSTLKPGIYRGQVVLASRSGWQTAVPLALQVVRSSLPEKLSLSLGGWDYTDEPNYGISAKTLEPTVAFLKRYHVDAPWAHDSVMPVGKHDESGKMVDPPDTTKMDRWLARWPAARFYFIACSYPEPLPETAAAHRRVRDWITFWANYLSGKGIKASQLGLLLMDEPHTAAVDKIIVSYAKAIREAEPQVQIFEDPTWEDPRQADGSLYSNSTVLCPNRGMWIEKRSIYEDVYLGLQKAGKQLAFYSCSGPVRSLDPYSYHRLQAWDCFRYGAVHMGFWAFGDTGGGSAWNELTAQSACFAPEFLGPDGCETSKHMEAIREGLYDYEMLTMLSRRVDAAKRSGKFQDVIERAQRLLIQGPMQVTQASGAESLQWSSPKDRSVADRVRKQAVLMLEALSK